MPHYKDGTLAMHGDLVLRREAQENGSDLVCIVMTIMPGSDSCNAQAIPLAIKQKRARSWLPVPPSSAWCITLKECEKIGDAMMRENIHEGIEAPALVT